MKLRRRRIAVIAAVTLLGIGASVLATSMGGSTASATHTTAVARLVNASGAASGTVRFVQQPGRVQISVNAFNVGQGFRGFHIHHTGDCSGTPPFVNAGGHLNVSGYNHADHNGDLPVLFFLRSFGARATVYTNSFTLAQLFDGNGSAVIVHELPDNYANIPSRYASGGASGPDQTTLNTGDSGARLLCGAVSRR